MVTHKSQSGSTKVSGSGTDTIAVGMANRSSVRELIPLDPGSSFRYYTHDYPHPFVRWGHHPEYEVHLIQKTSGRYVVGDVIDSFDPGQLMMVGPNLPHYWISDLPREERISDRDAVLHFSDEWIRGCQSAMQELGALEDLLARSRYGIEFLGESATLGAAALLRIGQATSGMERVIRVLDLLRTLAAAPVEEARPVVREWLPQTDSPVPSHLAEHAIDYILENLTGEVRLSEAARLASMSDSAFSRYFKAASGKTFTEMVVQLRLTRACRLLERTSDSIASIAASVGYQNLSNFNRQFLQTYGVTPRAHRQAAKSRREATDLQAS